MIDGLSRSLLPQIVANNFIAGIFWDENQSLALLLNIALMLFIWRVV